MSSETSTRYNTEELKCPKCGRVHRVRKYSLINVTEKPAMKEDILKNRIFHFMCEECALDAPLTYDCLYLDSKKKLAVRLVTEETKDEPVEAPGCPKGSTRRIVDNINDLKEKIMIRDKQLDDRVIELVKIGYLRQMNRELEEDTLYNILFDYHDNDMYFLLFFQKKGMGRIPLNMQFYHETENKYASKIRALSKDDFMKVDMEWAGQVYFDRS